MDDIEQSQIILRKQQTRTFHQSVKGTGLNTLVRYSFTDIRFSSSSYCWASFATDSRYMYRRANQGKVSG